MWISLTFFFFLLPAGSAVQWDSADVRFFRERILPVLQRQCYGCHAVEAGKAMGGMLLDNRAGLLQGGDSGAALVPGDAEKTLLIQAIRHAGGLKMPFERDKLPESVIADFVRWIEMGAPDPREGPVGSIRKNIDYQEARQYWAFQSPRKAQPPAVKDADWPGNVIDVFILSKLEERGLSPSAAATREDLVRRATFDVLGLPPSPHEVEAFVNDDAPDAYERLVDRLLESPHYGEKWGQMWLDVVRYAESEGFEYDRELPGAWRFRDYVIRSFNEDKPFDRFIREQLAGDEIQPVEYEQLIAAGFHRFGPVRRNAGNQAVAVSRNEVLIERTDIIGSAFLGLTLGCARCHDHKFDPITQEDYYSLQAYLGASREHNEAMVPKDRRDQWQKETDATNNQLAQLRQQLRRLKDDKAAQSPLREEIQTLEKRLPPPLPTAATIENKLDTRTDIHLLQRGLWEQKGDRVRMRPPLVLTADERLVRTQDYPTPRTALAKWITHSKNPLTARVLVNRLWLNHFGNGIVNTPNDFGKNGESPSHPELLDTLALRLIESGWRLKPLHRLMMLSKTYRQSSQTPPSDLAREWDPMNRLLWRFNRRRLRAEEIRDALLAVAGRLNREMFGKSVMVPVEAEMVKLLYKPSQWTVTEDVRQHDRRSVYLIAKRNLRIPFLEVFDQPTLQNSCPKRESSTHAPQALELLNGRTSNALAQSLADRLREEVGDDSKRQIERAWRLVAGRKPSVRESQLALEFLREQPLREFTLALFNLNAFLYVL